MVRISSDVTDDKKWNKCYRKNEVFVVEYKTNGVVFVSPYDGIKTCANYDSPIVFTDKDGVMFAETIKELTMNYVDREGNKITSRFIDRLRDGETLTVRPNVEWPYYYIHADVKTYGYDCPFGLNRAGTVCGSGDYLVCRKLGGYKYAMNHYRYNRYYVEE